MVERFNARTGGPVQQVRVCTECDGAITEDTYTITWMKNDKLHGTYCSLECLWKAEEKDAKQKQKADDHV